MSGLVSSLTERKFQVLCGTECVWNRPAISLAGLPLGDFSKASQCLWFRVRAVSRSLKNPVVPPRRVAFTWMISVLLVMNTVIKVPLKHFQKKNFEVACWQNEQNDCLKKQNASSKDILKFKSNYSHLQTSRHMRFWCFSTTVYTVTWKYPPTCCRQKTERPTWRNVGCR